MRLPIKYDYYAQWHKDELKVNLNEAGFLLIISNVEIYTFRLSEFIHVVLAIIYTASLI